MQPRPRPFLALATLLAAPIVSVAQSPERLSSSASQSFPAIALSYTVASGISRCPDVTAFRAAVAARLGRDPFVASTDTTPAPRGQLSVSIQRVGRTHRARITWNRHDGAPPSIREVSTPSNNCSALVSVTALAVSVALDTMPPASPPPSPPPPSPMQGEGVWPYAPTTPSSPPPPPPPSTPPPSPPPPAPIATTATFVRPWVFLGPVVGAGLSPGGDLGLALDLGLVFSSFGVSVGARGDLPVVTAQPSTGGSAYTQRFQAELALCWQRPVANGVLRLNTCALGAVTALFAEGRGVDEPRHETAWLGAVGARAAVDLRLSARFALRLRLDALVPITRAVVRLDQQLVWEGAWMQGNASLGGVFYFQ